MIALLRNQYRPVGETGLDLERLNPDRERSGLCHSRRHRQIHIGNGGKSVDGHLLDRCRRCVVNDDRELRHQMAEEHRHRGSRRGDLVDDGPQQIGLPVSRTLVLQQRKFPGLTLRRVGITGRQRGGLLHVVVPKEIFVDENRSVIGHRMVPDIGFGPLLNGQADPVPRLEPESRHPGLHIREDFNAKRRCGLPGTCHHEPSGQKNDA